MKLSDLIRKLFPSYVSKKELKEKLEFCSKDLSLTIDELMWVKKENAALIKDINLLSDLNDICILRVEKEINSKYVFNVMGDDIVKQILTKEIAPRIYDYMRVSNTYIKEKDVHLVKGQVYLLSEAASYERDKLEKCFEGK